MDEPSEVASEFDAGELNSAIEDLRQGDVLDVAKLAMLFSPDAPAHVTETEGVPSEEPVMTMEQRLKSGLSVVVSQTCDLRRLPDIEPYLLIAPLTAVSGKTYDDAAMDLSVRYFAYPEITGHEDKDKLVVDMRAVSSLEKTALLSPHIERVPCPLTDPRRQALCFWLGQRFGRTAFPVEVDNQVIKPIEQAVKRVRENSAFDGFFASVIYIGLSWTPGRTYCSLLLLTDSARREQHSIGSNDVEAATGRLKKALDYFIRDGDYTIIANVHDVAEVSAAELLTHYQLRLDIEAAQLP